MAAPTEAQIDRIAYATERAEEGTDYVSTFVVQMELVEGENYKMNWTDAFNGHFVPRG